MPRAQFEPIYLADGDYIAYFLRDTPHASHCIWMIPGTWIEED